MTPTVLIRFFLVFSGKGNGGAAHFLPQKHGALSFIKPR
jgi:hypothetical protein